MCVSRLHRVVGPLEDGRCEVEDAEGRRQEVSLLALDGPPPTPGEWLVVHSGYAIERVDAAEASATLEEIRHAEGAPWT